MHLLNQKYRLRKSRMRDRGMCHRSARIDIDTALSSNRIGHYERYIAFITCNEAYGAG